MQQKHLLFYPSLFRLFIVAVFALFPSFTSSQNYTRYILNELSSSALDGRGYVNDGAKKAADFIAEQFDSLGLEAIDNSYFQSFMLKANTFPNEMNLQVNEDTLRPGIDYLIDPMSGGGIGTDFTLYKVNIYKRKQLEKLNKQIHSLQNVALLIDLPDTLSSNGKMLFMQTIYLLAEQWPVILSTKEKLTWSVSDMSVKKPIFLVYNKTLDTKDNVSFSVNNKVLNLKQRNVIALKKGFNNPNKYLLICAHYDHLGRMGKDTYFPGANDNASGVAEMLAIAANLKSDSLDHSLVFIAFAGEEAGLKGSFHFVKEALLPLDSIKFVLNLDISGTGDEGITVVNANEFDSEFHLLNEINDSLNLIPNIKARGPTANSDHYPFYEKGIPSFFIYTRGGIKAYHDVFDKAETLPLDKADELLTLYSLFLKKLDQAEDW